MKDKVLITSLPAMINKLIKAGWSMNTAVTKKTVKISLRFKNEEYSAEWSKTYSRKELWEYVKKTATRHDSTLYKQHRNQIEINRAMRMAINFFHNLGVLPKGIYEIF